MFFRKAWAEDIAKMRTYLLEYQHKLPEEFASTTDNIQGRVSGFIKRYAKIEESSYEEAQWAYKSYTSILHDVAILIRKEWRDYRDKFQGIEESYPIKELGFAFRLNQPLDKIEVPNQINCRNSIKAEFYHSASGTCLSFLLNDAGFKMCEKIFRALTDSDAQLTLPDNLTRIKVRVLPKRNSNKSTT